MELDITCSHLFFIEVLVKVTSGAKGQPKFLIAGLFHNSPNRADQLRVPTVVPSSLLGDGLNHLGSGAPTLLTGLQIVAPREFLRRLCQVVVASFNVRTCLNIHNVIVTNSA